MQEVAKQMHKILENNRRRFILNPFLVSGAFYRMVLDNRPCTILE
jgi:hypothetical protein